MRSDSCQYPINGAPSSSGRRERLGYVRDCKLRSMKLKIRHSDKYRGAAHELRPNPDALSGAKTFKQTARRNPRLSKPSVQTSTPGIGTLTSAFREATAAVRKNKVPLDVKKKKKSSSDQREVRACSQNRCRGSENYSSRSHLSLEKAAPARRPDIPRTTVSGGCARPPARLSTSTHNTHTPGRTRHHLSAVHSSPQRASMSRNDTWHSRVRGNTPAQQPSGLPASTGSAGDSDWRKKEGSNDPPGAQPAAAVRRLHAPLPPLA